MHTAQIGQYFSKGGVLRLLARIDRYGYADLSFEVDAKTSEQCELADKYAAMCAAYLRALGELSSLFFSRVIEVTNHRMSTSAKFDSRAHAKYEINEMCRRLEQFNGMTCRLTFVNK